jgi:hypothetical protein
MCRFVIAAGLFVATTNRHGTISSKRRLPPQRPEAHQGGDRTQVFGSAPIWPGDIECFARCSIADANFGLSRFSKAGSSGHLPRFAGCAQLFNRADVQLLVERDFSPRRVGEGLGAAEIYLQFLEIFQFPEPASP